jgi:hypothetical protein
LRHLEHADQATHLGRAKGPLSVDGYLFTDAATPRFGFSGMPGPGERRVVFGSDAVTWERDNGQPFGFSLGNTGDSAMLWQIGGRGAGVAPLPAARVPVRRRSAL